MQHGQTAAAVQRDGGPSPLIVAHRGAWQHAPQNSLRRRAGRRTVNDPRSLQALSAHPAVAALITDAPAEALALAPAGSHPVDLAESRE